jgi:hypothetical protein
MSLGESEVERRRYGRVAVALRGRYMLADGKEYDCQIVDVSPVGFAIRGPLAGDLGERVVAYVEELGRIEGVIVRRAADDEWFALDLRVPSSRLHKLAKKIDWLARQQAVEVTERRRFVRFDQEEEREQTTLRLSDGRKFVAGLIDVSTGGAALEVYVTPPIGALVTVGEQRSHVSRHFEGGIAVIFDREATVEIVDEIETARAHAEAG